MQLNLSGLTAVVTGGSSGIGAAIVRTLAAEGCNVFFCARGQERIETMLASVGSLAGKVSGTAIDVNDRVAFEAWLNRIGAFDIFIANVSAFPENWDDAIETDIRATVNAAEAAIPFLLKSPCAALTYIGSKLSSQPSPRSAAYGASKAAMAHYMKSLSSRLLPSVRVNTVSPGDTLVDGGFWDNLRIQKPSAYAKVVERNPMKRLATPEEIAQVVTFISSPAASFVSGANWYVDGGSINHVQV